MSPNLVAFIDPILSSILFVIVKARKGSSSFHPKTNEVINYSICAAEMLNKHLKQRKANK